MPDAGARRKRQIRIAQGHLMIAPGLGGTAASPRIRFGTARDRFGLESIRVHLRQWCGPASLIRITNTERLRSVPGRRAPWNRVSPEPGTDVEGACTLYYRPPHARRGPPLAAFIMWIAGGMASELPDADSAMSRSIRFDEPTWRLSVALLHRPRHHPAVKWSYSKISNTNRILEGNLRSRSRAICATPIGKGAEQGSSERFLCCLCRSPR